MAIVPPIWVSRDFRRRLENGVLEYHRFPIRVTEWSWPNAFIDDENSGQYRSSLDPLVSVSIRNSIGGRQLTYLTKVEVVGDANPHPVSITFFENPPYDTFGLKAIDFPRVWADLGMRSKHRMADDALCLYNPFDHSSQRWQHENGLPVLLAIAADHLFKEQVWRDTGAWPGLEAPHGVPKSHRRTA